MDILALLTLAALALGAPVPVPDADADAAPVADPQRRLKKPCHRPTCIIPVFQKRGRTRTELTAGSSSRS
ncbi:unnamed protein product [Cutaneotrichosporon oleaginosum]